MNLEEQSWNPDLSKQKITFNNGWVEKYYASIREAVNDFEVAHSFRDNGFRQIAIPEYQLPEIICKSGKAVMRTRFINGNTALKTNNVYLLYNLVVDLALFHHLFSPRPNILTSCSLYRDAMPSNVLIRGDSYIHIDFASSDRYVHSLDDLAMLLNPYWVDITEMQRFYLVQAYFQQRDELTAYRPMSHFQSYAYANPYMKQRYNHYEQSLITMNKRGVPIGNLRRDLKEVDFRFLRMKDFDFFHHYRLIRARYYQNCIWRKE